MSKQRENTSFLQRTIATIDKHPYFTVPVIILLAPITASFSQMLVAWFLGHQDAKIATWFARAGQFGDQFGFVTCLTSAFTLLVVFMTYRKQGLESIVAQRERNFYKLTDYFVETYRDAAAKSESPNIDSDMDRWDKLTASTYVSKRTLGFLANDNPQLTAAASAFLAMEKDNGMRETDMFQLIERFINALEETERMSDVVPEEGERLRRTLFSCVRPWHLYSLLMHCLLHYYRRSRSIPLVELRMKEMKEHLDQYFLVNLYPTDIVTMYDMFDSAFGWQKPTAQKG